MKDGIWRLIVALVLGGVLLFAAWLLISTSFMIYDDEGYLLQTYRDFTNGHSLYTEIFSQYGPWPYLYHGIIGTMAGEPIGHMLGRGVTACHWLVCALLSGALTLRLTRSPTLGVGACLLVFGLLWQMTWEPSHPGGLIAAMLAITATTVAVCGETRRWTTLGIALGVAAALLMLTKINVGLFFVAGAGAVALRYTHWSKRLLDGATSLATCGLLALPWGLMWKNLHEPRVMVFSILFTLSAAGLLWVTPITNKDRRIPAGTWITGLTAFAVVTLAVVICVWMRGTGIGAVVRAVLLDPLNLPANFLVTIRWSPWIWPATVFCGVLTGLAGWQLRTRGTLDRRIQMLIIAGRLGALALLAVHYVTWITPDGPLAFVTWCLPLLPVFAIRVHTQKTEESARWTAGTSGMVALLALPQVLHAYPVAGSQLGWGTFLLIPVFAAGFHDCWSSSAGPLLRTWLPRLTAGLLVVIGGVQVGLLIQEGRHRQLTSRPLDLHGAENILLDGKTRLALRTLTINAAVHADVLFSRPGMYSFNQWSGVPTPTRRNATHWFWLLNNEEQEAIIQELATNPRSAIITNRSLESLLKKQQVPTTGPLATFLQAHYEKLVELGDFTFQVPTGSLAVPFGRAEVQRAVDASSAEGSVRLQANIVLNGTASGVELREVNFPWHTTLTYPAASTRITLEPITAAGGVVGPTITLPHDTPFNGLYRLSVYTIPDPALGSPGNLVLTVVDKTGRPLAEAGF